jgi:hypothetical protein
MGGFQVLCLLTGLTQRESEFLIHIFMTGVLFNESKKLSEVRLLCQSLGLRGLVFLGD